MLTTKDMFKNMCVWQDELNKKVDVEWKDKALSREFDYGWAFICELVELSGSMVWIHSHRKGFKWWSKEERFPEDDRNDVLEIVDAWHFLLSTLLASYPNAEKLSGDLSQVYDTRPRDEDYSPRDILRQLVTNYSTLTLLKRVRVFFDLMDSFNISLRTLYAVYLGKVTLNHFRQDNGYKEGKYKKKWTIDGKEKEDNYFLMNFILDSKNELTQTDIRAFLESHYSIALESKQ